MSTNQAFIKAYRHDASELSPRVRDRAANAPRNMAAQAMSSQAARLEKAELIGSTVAYVSPGTAYELDSFEPVTPTTATPARQVATSHFATSTEDFPIAEPRAGETIATARADRATSGVKRPLSSFTNRAGRAAAPAPLSLQPGTTVASFQWPDVCRQLIARHGRRFDHVVDSILAQAEQGRSLFGVLGLFRGVGCSTTTLCLTARLVRDGRRVAVVDGHFQVPTLANSLSAQPTAWWQDVLERGAPLADAMIRAEDDHLDLLPLEPHAPRDHRRHVMAANGLQLSATAGALRHAYDLVIIDLGTFFDPNSQPAALQLVENMRISSLVAVTEPGRQDPRDLITLTAHLAEFECDVLGIVENRTTA